MKGRRGGVERLPCSFVRSVEMWYENLQYDPSVVTIVGGIVLVAIASTWVIKKVIKMLNRS